MNRRKPLREGDIVRVRGSRVKRVVDIVLTEIEGGIVLDQPVIDSRYWNEDSLVLVKRCRKARP